MGISEEELLQSLEPQKPGISEEEAVGSVSFPEQAKQTAAPFLMGFEKGVPFGQDISAGVGTALSYAGVGPKYVPTEGTFGERFSAAKKAHEKAYEKTAEESPWTSAAGQLAGTVYSLPMFGAAAPVETAVAGKVVPAAEKVLGPYGEGLIDLTSQGIKGAMQGSVYGLGEGETLEERLQNAKSGGEWGGIIGASLPALGKSLGISRLSPAEEAAERMGAPLPASVGSQHLVTRPLSEALGIFPLTKGIMESSIANRQARLGEALIEKGGFTEGLEKHIVGGGAKKAIEDYLTSDITKGHRDLMSRKWAKVQDALGPRANIIRTPLTNTKNYLDSITPQLERLGLPTSHLKTYMENANKPRGLIYRDIKQLKESVGELLETDYFQKGRKDRVLDEIYHKLNDDLKIATERIGGPDALRAFKKANDFSTKMFARREALAPLLGPGSKFSDEQVYDRILNAAHNNSDLIRRAKTIINRTDPEAWKNMTSRAAEQLGRTPKNQEWSPAKFVENYNKLSPTGKNVLFGHSGSPQRKIMEDVYAAANKYVETGKDKHYSKLTLAMVSGAASYLGAAAAAANSLAAGSWVGVGATVAGAYPVSLILSQPRLAHLFSKHLSNPENEQYIKNFRDAVRSMATQMTKEHYEEEERPQRASGGKIGNRDYPAKKLSRVEKALKRAQDALAMETKPIMNVPDEAVAQALHLAKDK